jgi:hypothetical protein
LRQRLDDLVFGADAELDEDFAKELLVVAALLLVQRAIKLLGLDQALGEQKLAERFSLERCNHRMVFNAAAKSD